MDSSSDNSEGEFDLGLGAHALASTLEPGGGLKPQMDSIFAEVAKSLPSINFDQSDVSSDSEEPIIFHRNLKTTQLDYDDDKDLDTSLSSDSASDFFKSPMGTIHIPSIDKNNPSAACSHSPMTFDNDLAALLAAQEGAEDEDEHVSSWKDLEKVAQRDKLRQKERDEAKAAGKSSLQDNADFSRIMRATNMVLAQIEENNVEFSSEQRVSVAESMVVTQIEENRLSVSPGTQLTAAQTMLAQMEENSRCSSVEDGIYDSDDVSALQAAESPVSLTGLGVSGAARSLLTQTDNDKRLTRNSGLSAAGRMLIAQIEENNRSGRGTRYGARTVDIDFVTSDNQRNSTTDVDDFDLNGLSHVNSTNHSTRNSSVSTRTSTSDGIHDSNREAEWLQSLKKAKECKRLRDLEHQRAREKELALMYMSAKAPHLSMQILDAIDLDSVLDTCNEMDNLAHMSIAAVRGYGETQTLSAGTSTFPSSPARSGIRGEDDCIGSPESDSLTLIQKLAKFSLAQAGQECDLSGIDPQTGATIRISASVVSSGATTSTSHNVMQNAVSGSSRPSVVMATMVEPVRPSPVTAENTSNDRTSSGTNTADLPKGATANSSHNSAAMTSLMETLAKKKPEPQTVFLDLRGFEHHRKEEKERMESVTRVLGLQQNGKRDSGDEEDEEVWIQQRQKLKKTLTSRGTSTPSFKQQRLKQVQPSRVINMQNKKSATKPPSSTHTSSIKTTASNCVSASSSTSAPEQTSTQTANSAGNQATAQDSNRITEEERLALLAREQEKARQKEAARVLREQQEKERAARLRMMNHLEGLRPTASVNGNQACAENTPIVFDLEASYEPRIPVLPINLDHEEVLLITVTLSSNGEITALNSRSKGIPDTAINTSPNGYANLLLWLFTLIPPNFNVVKEALKTPEKFAHHYPDNFPPFHVVGMQQLWVDEKLTLAIVVCPSVMYRLREDEKDELRLLKKVKKGDHTTRFQRFVSTFLSRNSLSTVIIWPQYRDSQDEMDDDFGELDMPISFYRPLPFVTKPFSTYMHIHKGAEAVRKIFNRDVSFYWQTVESHGPESFCQHGMQEMEGEYELQNTICLVNQRVLFRPRIVMDLLYRTINCGLDICGLRILYPTQSNIEAKKISPLGRDVAAPLGNNSQHPSNEGVRPLVAFAFRGPLARLQLMSLVGPSDYSIAKRTDPDSLIALYGNLEEGLQIFCPRNLNRANSEIARWFGGRVPDQGSIDVGLPYKRKDVDIAGGATLAQPQGKGRKGRKPTAAAAGGDLTFDPVPSRPPAALTATTLGHVILAMPPLIPPWALGHLMQAMQEKNAFQPRGIRRLCLNMRRAAALGIPSSLHSLFLPGVNLDAVAMDGAQQQESKCPSTIMILERENALHHASSLALNMTLEMQSETWIWSRLQERTGTPFEPLHLFHFADYSEALVTALGGNFSKCPEFDPRASHSFSSPSLDSSKELEQTVTVIVVGRELSKDWGKFLAKLQSFSADPMKWTEFELVGLKWIPHMTPFQAREVTPYEIGDKDWKTSVHFLSSVPAVVFAFRGVNAFKKLEPFVSLRDQTSHTSSTTTRFVSFKSPHPTRLMSRNSEEAYRLLRLFFSDSELFPDPTARCLMPYLPESRLYYNCMEIRGLDLPEGSKPQPIPRFIELQDQTQESILDSLLCGPSLLTTFLLVKPRAVCKHLAKILRKVVQEGFTIVGLRMAMLEQGEVERFFAFDKMTLPQLFPHHLEYLTSRPCVLLALSRENAVKKLADLVGPDDPQQARRQNQFYWRGIFGSDPVHNAVHASRSYFEAIWDQRFFFQDGLCCEKSENLDYEQIVCPAVDSIMDVNFSQHRQAVRMETSLSEDTSTATPLQKVRSLLMQTTCLVLPPKLTHALSRQEAPFVEILDLLLGRGFELVGARMVWMTEQKAEQLLHILHAGSFDLVSELTSGPSLVMAMQRDNAVLAFENTVGGSMDAQTILNTYGKDLHRPTDLKQAQQLLALFFDQLMPGSHMAIQPISTTAREADTPK